MICKLPLCLLGLLVLSATALLVQAQPRKRGVKYALLIGIRDYEDKEIHRMSFADNDIVGLATVLIDEGDYRPENVTVMVQKRAIERRKPQLDPVSANIHKQLATILKSCGEEDSLLIALVGYGLQFKDQKDYYFCPADAKLYDKKTLISLGELYRLLGDKEKCKARSKLLLTDFCNVSRYPKLENAPDPQNQVPPAGVAAFFSCRGMGGGNDYNRCQGVFFHLVIKGLRGETADNQGIVKLPALVKYVKEESKKCVETIKGPSGKVYLKEIWPRLAGESNEGTELIRLIYPHTVTVDVGDGVKMEFVRIPAGKFLMGSSKGEKYRHKDEEQHEVEITRPFYLGKYEVTQEQYERIVGKNPSYFKRLGKDFPVEQVSWEDAAAFCRKLSDRDGKRRFRLPTEAEWEYACRAGMTDPFNFGSRREERRRNGNFIWNIQSNIPGFQNMGDPLANDSTCSVYSNMANDFGLFNMHGNVGEWCLDWYGTYEGLDKNDPLRTDKRDATARVWRSGSWEHEHKWCSSASRHSGEPGYFSTESSIGNAIPRSQTLFGNAVRETLFRVCFLHRGGGSETEFREEGSQTEFGNQGVSFLTLDSVRMLDSAWLSDWTELYRAFFFYFMAEKARWQPRGERNRDGSSPTHWSRNFVR